MGILNQSSITVAVLGGGADGGLHVPNDHPVGSPNPNVPAQTAQDLKAIDEEIRRKAREAGVVPRSSETDFDGKPLHPTNTTHTTGKRQTRHVLPPGSYLHGPDAPTDEGEPE